MAKQKQIFIVKLMPQVSVENNGCLYLRGDVNKAYTREEAEVRAAQVASESRREVGVFALECVFRPPINVERIEVEKETPSSSRKAQKATGCKRTS